jgi:hypothetical protein
MERDRNIALGVSEDTNAQKRIYNSKLEAATTIRYFIMSLKKKIIITLW